MLLTPRQDIYNNMNNNMNLSPHHLQVGGKHPDNGHDLGYQLTEQLLSTTPYSPRPGQKSKCPPHIKICPPDSTDGPEVIESYYYHEDELDNEVFQSPTLLRPSSPTSSSLSTINSDEKHEVYSGRLYLIRHTGAGSTSSSSSPTRSPSRSRSPPTSFSFRTSPPSSQSSSSSPSSPSSPRRKMPVFVRVYRCNMDHFAIISRDVIYTGKPVYVNMRHCRVIPGDCLGRFIVAGKCDSGNVIEFEAPELSTLEQWLDAFQTNTPPASPSRTIGGGGAGGGVSGSSASANTPPIPRSPALPTLAETDEED